MRSKSQCLSISEVPERKAIQEVLRGRRALMNWPLRPGLRAWILCKGKKKKKTNQKRVDHFVKTEEIGLSIINNMYVLFST